MARTVRAMRLEFFWERYTLERLEFVTLQIYIFQLSMFSSVAIICD
jgi:hypothetical protein